MYINIIVKPQYHWLKICGGIILFIYFLLEDHRNNKWVSKIASYKNSLTHLHYLEMETNIIQCLIGPTEISGVNLNRMRQIINNYISYNESLMGIYDVKPSIDQNKYRLKIQNEFFNKTQEIFERSGPNTNISVEINKEMLEVLSKTKTIFHEYYQNEIFRGIINIDNFDTEPLLRKIEKKNNCLKTITTLLFIIGNTLLWFA
ncbi:MAG: hypothetical protein Q7U71_07775 [bacterium]|nr:hypothetical protein [bacterium]